MNINQCFSWERTKSEKKLNFVNASTSLFPLSFICYQCVYKDWETLNKYNEITELLKVIFQTKWSNAIYSYNQFHYATIPLKTKLTGEQTA